MSIYLDYNATTPIDPEVADAMRPYLESVFGNPSSSHAFGVKARMAVETARNQVATMLGCDTDEVVFTSGGSESNNMAIKGVAYCNQHRGRHIITTTIEHPAVTEVCSFLEKHGFEVTSVGVDSFGIVNVGEIEQAIRPDTILISVMHANNETGSIQPIEEIGRLAHERGIIFHCDAAQSVGKIPAKVRSMQVDLLSVAGHKLYAPKGIGVLYIRRGVTLEKLIHGADHERNMRAGTENVLEIVGLGKACEIAGRDLNRNMKHMKELRDQLHDGITASVDDVKLNGHPDWRLPNTLSLSFRNVDANTLLSELTGMAASAGAACHSGEVEMSRVLSAMKLPGEWAMGTIRFSTGRFLTKVEVDQAIEMVSGAVGRLRAGNNGHDDEELHSVRLTHFTHGMGCACKLRPQLLEQVLRNVPVIPCADLLVGPETSDDAAVYRLNDETALVETLDFFTPIVDDPYQFGAIAAANALSDVYAMGARPLFALNIAAFPSNRLPMSVLEAILHGASDKAAEAGIPIVGGHTVDDTEPKFGLAVTGVVHPDKILTNKGAREGDILILTKPLGTGIISTAVKQGVASGESAREAASAMARLNKIAAETMALFPVHACTDITGFGLLGHLREMADGAGMSFVVHSGNVPFLQGALQLAQAGIIPGGTKDNLNHVSAVTRFSENVSIAHRYLLADAQTSGGLLIALAENDSGTLLESLHLAGVKEATIIGTVQTRGDWAMRVE